MIPERQIGRQPQVAQHAPFSVDLVRAALGQIPGVDLAAALARAALELHGQRSKALCSIAGVLMRTDTAPARATATSPNNPEGCDRLGLADLRFERGRVVEPAMHGAQDRGLRRQREMFELALVRVVRVADATRAGQALDESESTNQWTRCNASVW